MSEARGPGGPIRIEETTVATVDGWSVTVGNILGGTAELGLYDEARAPCGERSFAVGEALEIAGRRWRVAHIGEGEGGENGFVELHPE